MTRSEYLLSLFEGFLGIGGNTSSPLHSDNPVLTANAWKIRGAGAALTAGLIAHQIHRSRAQTRDKVRQAGLGDQHTQARNKLWSLRKQHLMTLGTNPALGMRIRKQKDRVANIENRGLARYHQGLVKKPSTVSTSIQRDKVLDYNRNANSGGFVT